MKATLIIRQAVRPWLKDARAGSKFLVAVSGGADSMALAGALALEARELDITLIPLIIDHGLQEGSAIVAHNAARSLEKLGYHQIEIREVKVVITDGMEASARRARYQAFDEAIAENEAMGIFLGHTMNDQAETVLLGLSRGSGTRSLSGMASVNGNYLRPLLAVLRATTLESCNEQGIEYWSDPQNESHDFLRVRIRKSVLPVLEKDLGPGVVEALSRSARILREDADALDELAKSYRSEHQDLLISELLTLPKALRARVLRQAIYEAGAPQGSITADHLAPVEALVTSWHGQGESALPGGVKVSRISGRLSLSRPI